MRKKIAFYLISLLFIFLPFSSWLVSFSGNPWVSLIRDVLIAAIFIISLFEIKKINKPSLIIGLLFIIYGLSTYFWHQSSPEQWLRGYRFLIFPVIFYISISLINFSDQQKKTILWIIFGGFIVLAAIAILEYYNIRVPLVREYLTQGSLENYQSLNGKPRLQSLLAGPNAFGIYLVAITAYLLSALKKLDEYVVLFAFPSAILVFPTYSRSALIGLFVLLLFFLFFYIAEKKSYLFASLVTVLLVIFVMLGGYKLYNIPKYQNYITHGASTTLRTEQIQRIFREKNDIGLFGRSLGTAGPSSQNRLDGGPNHWSENIYLDIFEELGLLGLALFISLVIAILRELSYNFSEPINRSAIYAIGAFSVMGLFINIYTGQIGIFLFWLLNGLGKKEKNNG